MTDDKPWLSLPDEEPPERGLAELMAAARAKADVMVHPPWWKRVLDLMKRPPVLALATVLVLLGGVLVVGRHPDEVQSPSPPPAVQSETIPLAAGSASSQVEAPPPSPPALPAEPPAKPVRHRSETPKKLKVSAPEKEDVVTGGAKLEIADPAVDDAEQAVQKAPVQRPEPLNVQLSRCRTAAVHKDCAGAKACAKQLEQRDRGYYDANVANDAAIKPCL